MIAEALVRPARQGRLWASFPANVHAAFVRLRGRPGIARDPVWTFAGQPEHLLAYALWGEIACDNE